MPGGFKITPSDLHNSGSQLSDFGTQVASGGDKLEDIGSRLAKNAGRDKSGVGSVLVKALGKGTEVAGKVFSEGGRVAGAAGKRLHTSATAHEHNESDLTKSFSDVHDPKGTPKSPHGSGSHDAPHHPPASDSGDGKKAGHTEPSSTNPDRPIGDHNKNPAENDTPTKDRVDCGDPIDMATGRMMLTQDDVELDGVLPLVLSRTHLSTYRLGWSFGPAWASTVDQRVEIDGEWVHFAAEDGTLLRYPRPVLDVDMLPELGPRWPLSVQEDGSLAITKPDQILFFAPFDGNQRPITGIVDARYHSIWFERDERGVLTGIEQSAGSRIAVTTENGLITAFSLGRQGDEPDLELVRYRYDEQRNLTEVINSSGWPLRFDYDAEHRIVGWEDRNGMWYRYDYDAEHRCVRSTGADGYLNYSYGYDRDNLRTIATDSLGATTIFQLNQQLQVIAQTDPLGRTTRWEYDRYDRMLAETDPLGATTRYRYTEDGQLAEIASPDGTRTVVEYEDGLPVTVVDPDGAVWRREYADTGELSALIDPLGARTSFGYDEHGHLATITDALGATTRIESTAAGLPTAVTDALGAVTRYDYDRFGRARSITDPQGGVTKQAWTIEGLPLAQTDPDGAVHRWIYDGEGNIRQSIDPTGLVSSTDIAAFDLPVTETAPDGAQLRYTYDTELRLTSITNATGQTWRYTYDPAGQLVSETDFDGRTHRYAYDPAGRLIERTNAAGQTVHFRWDANGRLVAQQIGEELTEYAYDPADRLVRARTAHTELVLEYNALGQVVAETIDGRTVRSRYDQLGRRVRRSTPSGAESAWEYDAEERPVVLRTAGQTMRFAHDAAGRETERRFGADAVLAQTWDAGSRLATQSVWTADSPDRGFPLRRYGYRHDGQLREVDEAYGGSRQYELDQAGRVTAVRGERWAESYAYDPAGNITRSEFAGPRPAAVDELGEREYTGTLLTRAGGFSYAHDAQGRTVLRQRVLGAGTETWRYEWDAADRLTAVTTPDGSRWTYQYDPIGRRIAKRRMGESGRVAEEVLFTWDGDQVAEQVHDRSRAVVWDWAPGTDRVLSQTERVTDRQGWVDRGFYAIVTDLVGTPTELVDPRGDFAWHADATLWDSTVSTVGSADTPLRFPGHYHDQETGLHYNRYRYYDPANGRYLSDDPLGLAPGPNPRAYVSNPTGWIDPMGLTPCRRSELHKNPSGPSLRVRGPRDSNKRNKTPNQINDQDSWNHVATSNAKVNTKKERATFKKDSQTIAEENRDAARHMFRQTPHMTEAHQDVQHANTSANALEQMGRHDDKTKPYWRKQDARDERLAVDANELHTKNPTRPQSMLDQTDHDLQSTSNKLEGAQAVLRRHNGVIIAGDHGGNKAFPFLTDNMKALKDSGVKTIYSESLRDDTHQKMVNQYLQTGKMHPDLQKFVNAPDNRGVGDMLTAAQREGVHVQGTGGWPARRPGPDAAGLHTRAGMYNTYASQVVQQGQAEHGGKYVMEVGEAHATTHAGPPGGTTVQGQHIPENFPGLGNILNVPALKTGAPVVPYGVDTFEQLR
ncbi:MAG TPA: RHS repeat-associated core domain-containing protein [Pseudonocardiaceae bacterium]|jgi:RHS repeat-associated protein|nr:RHS repeat-associated core domain-containing protein [Pseudonocardiaceae bacterium]